MGLFFSKYVLHLRGCGVFELSLHDLPEQFLAAREHLVEPILKSLP